MIYYCLIHIGVTERIKFLLHLLVAWSPKASRNSHCSAVGSDQVTRGQLFSSFLTFFPLDFQFDVISLKHLHLEVFRNS